MDTQINFVCQCLYVREYATFEDAVYILKLLYVKRKSKIFSRHI